MGTAADSVIARERLLEAACQAFAEHGFQHATVRDICRRADLNLGAINYHFGSKRELYAEVLRRAELPIEPPLGDLPTESLTCEERLRAFITFFLASTLEEDEPPWAARVLANELANPTDLLDELIREAILPHFSRLRLLIADLLGGSADSQTVDDHAFGVVSQVVFYRHSRPIIERVAGRRYGADDMSRLAQHVFESVCASLDQERRGLSMESAEAAN